MTLSSGKRLNFSVIIVSHQRPFWLKRCLKAVCQLQHPSFEIVVVADTPSLELQDGNDFKRRAFETANIAQARNIGIAAASGEICAFIDDDAVPEPLWLQHMEAAFLTTQAAAVVGYVRGRNGISFQSRVDSVDASGETHREDAPQESPFIPALKDGHALKLVGTNAAFRVDALEKLGGFDPAYAFYMDDTDISLRLAALGLIAAVAPLAEVHHAFAASKRRTKLRTPTRLADIGRSAAIFMRRHRGISQKELYERIHIREKARLIRHMVQGTCEPRDVKTLLQDLQAGWTEGLEMDLPEIETLEREGTPFSRLEPIEGHKVIVSRLIRRRARLAVANKLAKNRHRVSLFSFSLTPVRHFVRYTESGVWVQTGGQFGRANRAGRIFRWCRFAKRTTIEINRVAKQRGI